MSDILALDFPVLQQGQGDFLDEVSYEVTAKEKSKKLTITHRLKGNSYIRELIKNRDAKFSVSLLYRDSSERQHYFCESGISTEEEGDGIIAVQNIDVIFSYAPEIMPSIVILKDRDITADSSSGLTDFWKNQKFSLPKNSRIATHPKLKFTGGDISNLLNLVLDKNIVGPEMRVEVNEDAGESEPPVTLWCGLYLYDALRNVSLASPKNHLESMQSAIITQALCAVYAYMHKHNNDNADYEESGVLLAHLMELENKTKQNWKHDEFNPSLAATKMHPYVLLSGEDDD